MTDLDDGSLLDRWRDLRDGDAFAEIARRHSPIVFDLTVRVLGDRAAAEDVLQEALLGLALETTRKPAEVGVIAWLARFAICRARNRRASERCRARRQFVVGSERPEDVMPEESLEQGEELEHALSGCDPEDRALLAMRFLHEWEYDRIAAALSISEGAARVRVHRALRNVRARIGPDAEKPGASDVSEKSIANRLAFAPVAALPAAKLDAAIHTTLALAKVHLGAPPNGVEQATAQARGLRVALKLAGAALAVVAAIAVSPDSSGGGRESARADRGLAAGSGDSASWMRESADATGAKRAPDGAALWGFPRPRDWERGALERLVLPSDGTAAAHAAPAPEAAPAAGDAAAPVKAPAVAAPAPDLAAAPAAAPAEDSPDALRSKVRGTCAAKGDFVSSDDERAGAFGVSPPAPDVNVSVNDAPRAENDADAPSVRANSGSTRARHAPPLALVPIDSLSEEERGLVDHAGDLLRQYLAAQGADDGASGGVRSVRSKFGKLRREVAKTAGGIAATAPRRGRHGQGVGVNKVVGLLTQVVLADPSTGKVVYFPRGADVTAALEEVIRVLGLAVQSPGALPDGALPTEGRVQDPAAVPSGAQSSN